MGKRTFSHSGRFGRAADGAADITGSSIMGMRYEVWGMGDGVWWGYYQLNFTLPHALSLTPHPSFPFSKLQIYEEVEKNRVVVLQHHDGCVAGKNINHGTDFKGFYKLVKSAPIEV